MPNCCRVTNVLQKILETMKCNVWISKILRNKIVKISSYKHEIV